MNTIDTARSKTTHIGREAAAGALDRASGTIRRGAKQAARLVERGGDVAAGAVESQAARVEPGRRRRLRRLFTSHPRRTFLAAMLLAAFVALLIIRARAGQDYDEDEDF
jgi:hypothetical protein